MYSENCGYWKIVVETLHWTPYSSNLWGIGDGSDPQEMGPRFVSKTTEHRLALVSTLQLHLVRLGCIYGATGIS